MTNAAKDDPQLHVRGMELLLHFQQALTTARDLPAIIAIVSKAARELAGADGATFVVRDGDHCHYAGEDAVAPLWQGARCPIEQCIAGWAMLHRETVVIEDIYADARVPAEVYRPTFVTSLAIAPIRRAKPVGAIGAYWATRQRPTELQLRLLQALADATAIAMDRAAQWADLEARLAARTEQLAAVNRELESFSYAVSHDLRAPLRAIGGFSQILREDHAAQLGDGTRHLDRISAATARMNQLLEDLLTLSTMSRGELVHAPFDVAALAREIVGELRRDQPAWRGEVVIADALPARGDARLVRVVLDSLLRNAWTFSAPRADARIEVGARDGAWFVQDNGVGFDAARATKLFVPFQRMHLAGEFPGNGVGLAIAHRIVLRHGGRIWADSKPGEGATFWFTLG